MNDDPLRYSKHCTFHKSDANNALEKCVKFLKCRDGDCVMDVGAGEGSVTFEILVPKLPTNFNKLVLWDVSPKFLHFAKNRTHDKRVEFFEQDITTSTIPDDFRGYFDHIFSFFCLHWIHDWEKSDQAMKNIFDMLKPGGDILFTLPTHTGLFDVWRNLARSEKWSPYFKNVESGTSPYYDINDPAEKMRTSLEAVGFVIHVCKNEECLYTFPSFDFFFNFAIAINPSLGLISEDERDDYNHEYAQAIRKHPNILFEHAGSENEQVHLPYKRLVVCGFKPARTTQM